MPNSNSAKKRMRQDEVRRLRNRSVKSAIKTQVRKLTDAVQAGDQALSETEYRAMTKRVDKAAAAGVIHKNAAGRVKSRLSVRVKALKKKSGAGA